MLSIRDRLIKLIPHILTIHGSLGIDALWVKSMSYSNSSALKVELIESVVSELIMRRKIIKNHDKKYSIPYILA